MDYNDYGVKKYLKLLSKEYKNIEEVSEEIINLQAILNLPKGTELFLSDLHGEYDYFNHILNNCAGIIKNKIESIYGNAISESERKSLAILIYYPEEKLELVKKETENMEEWYNITLYRLIEVCKNVSSKYTRSKVRKALPSGFDYIIDELLHTQGDAKNKDKYYQQIIKTIIDIKRADAFIIALANLIKRMAIDHLHILGDIYDRGQRPDLIIDKLVDFHSIDIVWGNHDILWMGAFCGNEACIANAVRICARYDNLDTLEEGYGINLRNLSSFATKTYSDDSCKEFLPKIYEFDDYTNSDKSNISKIHKAITIIALKLEGLLIMKHPEYNMYDRLLLDKINIKKGTVTINGREYRLKDSNFPTINSENPYQLTTEELEVISKLKTSFMQSQRLAKHVNFLYSKGGMYKIYNNNLLFHGCIPMTEDGNLKKIGIFGKQLKGKELFDTIEQIAHRAYSLQDKSKTNESDIDSMWLFWCSPDSPLFGKNKAAVFERYFLDDEETHVEINDFYYMHRENEKTVHKLLENFGINNPEAKIINGHIESKKEDVNPIKANGKLIVISGGLTEKYRKGKNHSRYILTYNSYGLLLTEVEKFDNKAEAVSSGIDIKSEIRLKEEIKTRKLVSDTDIGNNIRNEIKDLKMLLMSYREGIIKEQI